MKAVILAAGEGKRLRPFTETIPKVMLPVANKPVLEYVIDAVKNNGINEIIIVVGYKKEVIMEHFKNYKGAKITYVVQEKQLGTGHALLHAKSHIQDTFIVLSGDNIIDNTSISKLIKDNSKYSILIKEHPNPSKYGAVFIEREKLREIVEKPREEIGKFISTGIYKLPKKIFGIIEELASEGIYDLSSTIQSIVDDGEKINTIVADLWRDIVYPWDLIHLNETMIKRTPSIIGGTIEKGVTIKGETSVGKDTTIYSGCYIVGPVIIGEGCEIGPNVCIFPSTTIGNNSVVQPFSQIGNTVIMNDSRIGSGSVIKNSVIGRGCIIENNFSSIDGSSTIEIEGEFKKLEKIGSMIGEDCNIDSNVIVKPGKIIGRRCNISSLKIIGDNIPSNTKVM
jgi:UDP-N-acetylglucosamine diphosphorylase / glucose-1-phosphate thymidylyltransferase / UDP-N-acetylgalactosamine diphosphorylase / glucosamine-1-phosphate N-acetyltransferase / galactosamine-1-phosphate N-acetyltransferase